LGDLPNAITNYQNSLTEHRTPDILTKLRDAEKAKLKAEKEGYVDPQKAEEARELGNQKFKEADWPGAVDAYSEMIKRAPEDPRGYSNRAACFIKLLSFPSAVQDCDAAIKRDPKFIRAYLRKAQAYFAMREYNKCLDVCVEAQEHDEGGKNTREIEQQSSKALQAQFAAREGETEEQTMERIQRDPEVCILFFVKDQLTVPDRKDPPGPGHADHPAAGQERPGRAPGAHEEPPGPDLGAEARRGRRDSHGPLNG
jgi:stress-induced-phosphoprotein 1